MNDWSETSFEFCLERDDIYKEFRILGYDFGQSFRRLAKISTNDFHDYYGICEWNGNMVTFLDGLLQSMCLAKPTRNLALPVIIKKLTIDPILLFDELRARRMMKNDIDCDRNRAQVDEGTDLMHSFDKLNEKIKHSFCRFEANIPFTFNIKTKTLVCKGVELEDIVAFTISRKTNTNDLVLDSYEFVPHFDNQAIDGKKLDLLQIYLEVSLRPESCPSKSKPF